MKTNHTFSLLLIVAAFLVFTLLNQLTLSQARLDLTQNGLYTLSDGTIEIVEELEEPINLYLFFSDKVSEDLSSLRTYAQRVKEMLREYQLVGGANINLEIIDPEPFSEAEDRAAAFGLQSVPVNQAGDELYFGLAGTNGLDGEEVIAFFQPDREAFLEYEVSKLIYSLDLAAKPKVGVYSGLDIDQRTDPATFQSTPAWVFLEQLRELFDVELLDEMSERKLVDIDILIVIHPQAMTDMQLFAIDQHVLGGGKLIAFVDPIAEMTPAGAPGMQMPSASSSDLNRLTQAWGVSLRSAEVLADADVALMVGDASGRPVRHLGILGFNTTNFSPDDIVTAPLETINMSTAGVLDVDQVDGIATEILVGSSEYASPLPAMQFEFLSDPAELQQGFSPTGERYVTAVRLSGRAVSAFPEGVDGLAPALLETDSLSVVIVADTDILADRLWVQVQSFFGQQIASAFADNGSFVANLVDNYTGSSALIGVRSRGQFARPFDVVNHLRRDAEAQYLQSAEDLQAQLIDTENQLAELETARISEGLLTLTAEQEAALENFQDEKLRIRKELRDVRHRLDKDIEDLGTTLKFLNILLLPLLLTGLMLGVGMVRRRGRAGQ